MSGIFDCHNDLLTELAFRREESRPFEEHWLGHLQKGDVKVQICPIFTADKPVGERLRSALFQLGAFHRAVSDRSDAVRWVRTREDLEEVLDGDDRIAMIPSLEGVEPFEEDIEMVDALWDLGVRMAGLTWNRSNAFATGGGEADDRGLTDAGRELVRRMQRRGYVIDLTHTSPQTYMDLIEMTDRVPPVLSHSGCRAAYDSPRNASDEQLSALAKVGGVAGVMLLPLTVDIENATLDRVVDHVDHMASILGDQQIGIGSDFFAQVVRSGAAGDDPAAALPANQGAANMAADAVVDGLEGPGDYGNLVAALEKRGWQGERLDGLLLGNFARVLAEALPPRSGN